MARPGPRRSARTPAGADQTAPQESPSPEPFTVPTYATPSTTQYTTPNFSTRVKPPLTAHASSSPPTPSSPTARPLNILTSAIANRKTIEEKHQEALAKKRKRDIEAQEGYKSLEEDLQKYKYTGGDPRMDWDAIRGAMGKVEGDLEESGRERSEMLDEEDSRKKRELRGRVTEEMHNEVKEEREGVDTEEREKKRQRGNVRKDKYDARLPLGRRRSPPEPQEPQGLAVDICSEEEDDEQFDMILASKNRSDKRTHRLLSPTIKPFRPVSKPIETPAQAQPRKQLTTKPTYTAQPRLAAPKIASSSVPLKNTQNTSNSRSSDKEEAARRRRAAMEKEEAAKRRRAAMTRATALNQPKDEYGDDTFDNLLGSATVFDDGTDIYADEGFDNMLAEALASGQDFE